MPSRGLTSCTRVLCPAPWGPRRSPPPEGDPQEYEVITQLPFKRKREKQSGIRRTCWENIFRGSRLTIHLLFKECQGWLA